MQNRSCDGLVRMITMQARMVDKFNTGSVHNAFSRHE